VGVFDPNPADAIGRDYEIEWRLLRDRPPGFEPLADPLAASLRVASLVGQSPSLQIGTIVDTVAYCRAYRVLLGNGFPPLVGIPLLSTATGPIGVREATSYAVNSEVVVLVAGTTGTCFILGAIPRTATAGGSNLPDYVHQASRCGIRIDDYHARVLALAGGGLVADRSSGGPIDGLSGEWGQFTETGLRLWLDSKQAQVAVDEFTGLFLFYRDQLTRLGGVNLEVSSSARTREEYDDEGEIVEIDGSTIYPWEGLGTLQPGVDPFRAVESSVYAGSRPELTALEPADPDQQPFHRRVRVGGYVGQGGRTFVQAPPSGALFRYARGQRPVGLIEQHDTLSGRHLLRAAKGIHLRRTGAIPVPVRVRRPEDPQGDRPENYRASGVSGSGEAHEIQSEVRATGKFQSVRRISCLSDLHAFVFNWEAQHAFHYHRNDWELPEESDTPVGAGSTAPDYAKLQTDPFLEPPAPVEVPVDSRYGSVKIYPNDSSFDLFDDGSVNLSDGSGAQISMVGGTLFIDAPGDIVFRSGRNIVLMSGRDTTIRSRRESEISSATGGVRVKAETDVQILAGNSGIKGGVLIESRAPGQFDVTGKVGTEVVTGGVTLRAAHGPVSAVGQNVYLRTGKGDSSDGIDGGGVLSLDAAGGTGPIVTNSSSFTRYLTRAAADHFSDADPGQVTRSNIFSSSSNQLAAGLSIKGLLVGSEGAIISNYVAIPGGHIFTEAARANFFQVSSLQNGAGAGRSLTESKDAIRTAEDSLKSIGEEGVADYATVFSNYLYAPGSIGADDTLKNYGFSFRTDAQYGSTEILIPEARWQRLARLSGAAVGTWTEPPVRAAETGPITYPWPGQKAWTKDRTFLTQDPLLFDPVRNLAKPRTDPAYRDPEIPAEGATAPDGVYPVIDL
jgi:hypothetical protein